MLAAKIFMRPRPIHALAISLLAIALGGCELLSGEEAAKAAAAREAEGKAVGGACRHSGRALEDCYVMNPKAMKSAVYAGWRDMDAYMRENNIQAVTPDLVDAPAGGKKEQPAESTAAAPAENPGKATEEKKAADEKKAKGEKKSGAKQSALPSAPETPLPRRFT